MWQILFPSLLADVIAIFVAVFVADVMATVADGIAINKTNKNKRNANTPLGP